ncbi:MAG: hypothetical protein QOG87_910 [Actinomycetota bacterium]|jgi:hypothetical protein
MTTSDRSEPGREIPAWELVDLDERQLPQLLNAIKAWIASIS